MEEIIEVFFDGHVFKPIGKVDLLPNRQYRLHIEKNQKHFEDAFDVLERLTGTVEGPEDWALNHDHYLYGKLLNKESDE